MRFLRLGTKNAYAVVSQRFRLNKDQKAFLPNAYLTLGMGNGQFRPLDELIRASVAEQRKANALLLGSRLTNHAHKKLFNGPLGKQTAMENLSRSARLRSKPSPD